MKISETFQGSSVGGYKTHILTVEDNSNKNVEDMFIGLPLTEENIKRYKELKAKIDKRQLEENMNDIFPHFLNLNGIVVNVDKILYIRKSEVNDTDSLIGFGDRVVENELHIEGLTPNQLFNLLYKYDVHLKELKIQGLT